MSLDLTDDSDLDLDLDSPNKENCSGRKMHSHSSKTPPRNFCQRKKLVASSPARGRHEESGSKSSPAPHKPGSAAGFRTPAKTPPKKAGGFPTPAKTPKRLAAGSAIPAKTSSRRAAGKPPQQMRGSPNPPNENCGKGNNEWEHVTPSHARAHRGEKEKFTAERSVKSPARPTRKRNLSQAFGKLFCNGIAVKQI